MTLISAIICSESGKPIISRQFMDITKPRIEGLIDAFPKLMAKGKQHTFMETDSVRYLYQHLGSLYMVLITTKFSNIFEDINTLRLFCQVTPEYCGTLDEKNILDNCFNLIFAFDQIITLGHKETVNLAQVCNLMEMNSDEENSYNAIRNTKIKRANEKMKIKAKEIQKAKTNPETEKLGGRKSTNCSPNISNLTPCLLSGDNILSKPPTLPHNQPTVSSNKTLKLGKSSRNKNSPLFE